MMKALMARVSKFLREECGLSAVEYAIAGALVIGVAAGGFVTLGQNVDSRIGDIAGCVSGPDSCNQ